MTIITFILYEFLHKICSISAFSVTLLPSLFFLSLFHTFSLLKKIHGKMFTYFAINFSFVFFDRMGCQRPESGSIKVFGYDPKTPESGVPGPGVGFMPQEVSLHNDLTILEMISYFGRLFFIPKKQLEDEIGTMMTVLQLPPRNRLIGTLSGGQKRR